MNADRRHPLRVPPRACPRADGRRPTAPARLRAFARVTRALRASFARSFLVLLISASVLVTGCFGSFGATRALYGWNEGVSGNKFVRTVVLWALIIVPVYEILLVGDFVIFNVIEFWTGDRLFADATIEQIDEKTFRVYHEGDVYTLVKIDDRTVDVSQNDRPLGRAMLEVDGSLTYVDVDGNVLGFERGAAPSL